MSTTSSALSKTKRIDVLSHPTTNPSVPNHGLVGQRTNDDQPLRVGASIEQSDYLGFFQNAYDATVITDQRGDCVNANRRMSEMLGYDISSLQKINFWQLVAGAGAELMDTVRASLASERFLRISAWCRRQDGSSFPAEIAVNQFFSGANAFFCFFIRDETLRMQEEDQLRTVQNAVNHARTGIGVIGLDGCILYANAALATLLDEANPLTLKGRPLDTLLGNRRLAEDLMTAMQAGQNALVDFAFDRQDGTTRWIQIVESPNLDSEDVLIGMVLSLVDISDRRRSEQAELVVERDKVMMESIGAVCHHLGQPIAVLFLSIEMMSRMKNADPTLSKELIRTCLEAAESLRLTLLELNELRHYISEPYPGPSKDRPASIVSIRSV